MNSPSTNFHDISNIIVMHRQAATRIIMTIYHGKGTQLFKTVRKSQKEFLNDHINILLFQGKHITEVFFISAINYSNRQARKAHTYG